MGQKISYDSFDEWLDEQDAHSSRRERVVSEFGELAIPWLRAAWGLGAIHSELRSDGHAAEAAKDVRAAGLLEAAEVIHSITLPESKKIMQHNAESIAKEFGIRELEISND